MRSVKRTGTLKNIKLAIILEKTPKLTTPTPI